MKPNGSKLWQQHCRFANGEKTLSHGAYPDVGIAEVRRNRAKAKGLLDGGIDLITQNKLDRIERERNARSDQGIRLSGLLRSLNGRWVFGIREARLGWRDQPRLSDAVLKRVGEGKGWGSHNAPPSYPPTSTYVCLAGKVME